MRLYSSAVVRNTLLSLLLAALLIPSQEADAARKAAKAKAAQSESAPAPEKTKETASEEMRIVSRFGFPKSNVGFLLIDPATGEVLSHHQADSGFIPASVSKVPATVAALAILGPEYRYSTTLRATGDIADGVLHGDLYLVGGGDPTLSFGDLMNMAEQLRRKGVRRISGNFYFDESSLVSDIAINNEQNDDDTYNSGISALTVDFNRVKMGWSINKSQGLSATFTPDLDYVNLHLGTRSTKGGTQLIYTGGQEVENWRLDTGGASSGGDWIPIKRPGRYTALVFRNFSKLNGIELPAPNGHKTPGNASLIYEHKSQPLSGIAEKALQFSNNLWTELIGMSAAARITGTPQSMNQAGATITQWYKNKLTGVDMSGLHLANSSGLSSETRVTPRQMVEILKFADNAMPGERGYLSLLPISGWKGTLANRMTGSNALKVWAKTGTMNYAKGLGGYLFSKDGRRLMFAVFVNDFAKRRSFDQMLRDNPGKNLGNTGGWNSQAGSLIYALVEHWVRSR